jgi:hypothetical protein
MLTDLIEPIVASIQRHMARLQAIKKMKPQPGEALPPADDLREASANLAEKEIQSIVQPEYARIADSQPDVDHKIAAVADAQRDLMKLASSRVQSVDPQLGGGLQDIVMKGGLRHEQSTQQSCRIYPLSTLKYLGACSPLRADSLECARARELVGQKERKDSRAEDAANAE